MYLVSWGNVASSTSASRVNKSGSNLGLLITLSGFTSRVDSDMELCKQLAMAITALAP